jgi:uncharacterized membrane protein
MKSKLPITQKWFWGSLLIPILGWVLSVYFVLVGLRSDNFEEHYRKAVWTTMLGVVSPMLIGFLAAVVFNATLPDFSQ